MNIQAHKWLKTTEARTVVPLALLPKAMLTLCMSIMSISILEECRLGNVAIRDIPL